MNEKSNFYVFERKEIFLVILFVILISITSFLFGLKMGSGYSFDKAGNTNSELEAISTAAPAVEFTSTEEEKVDKLISETKPTDSEGSDINKKVEDSLKQKLVEEFSNENNKKYAPVNPPTTAPAVDVMKDDNEVMDVQKKENESSSKAAPSESKDSLVGKYTIQLGSSQSLKEATDFAEGFKVLGYTPIVNEVQIPGRGNWFRVSIGIFDSLNDAKSYLIKNKSLFSDRDYVLVQFD